VDEEAWLDRLLDSLPQAVPSATLKAALQRQASALRAGGSLSRLLKALWPEAPSAWPAGVLAASTALGIAIGIALPALGLTSQELTAGDLVSYAFSALDASEWL
jgi:urease accessory protein UreF